MMIGFARSPPAAQPPRVVEPRRDEMAELQSLAGLKSWRRYAIIHTGIHTGMRAEAKFPTFQTRRTPAVFGTLKTVSRDRLIDDTPKQAYFSGIFEIDERQVPNDVKHRLLAGLPAEVVVSAGERTALDYMVAPLFDAMGHAFHER